MIPPGKLKRKWQDHGDPAPQERRFRLVTRSSVGYILLWAFLIDINKLESKPTPRGGLPASGVRIKMIGQNDSKNMVLRYVRIMYYFGIYFVPSSLPACTILGDIGSVTMGTVRIPLVYIALVIAFLCVVIYTYRIDLTLSSRGESMTRIYLSLSREEKDLPNKGRHILGGLLTMLLTWGIASVIRALLT